MATMLRRITRGLLPALALCGATVCWAQEAGPEGRFTYTGPSGVGYTVTADGLASVSLGGREVAKGDWHAVNGDWINKLTPAVEIGKVTDKTLAVVDRAHARVRHAQGDVVVTYDYTFAGEDVTIQARVENFHPTGSLQVIGFQGLQLIWQETPQGMMPCQHGSWLAAHPHEFFHPGMANKIGGSYGADKTVGFGCSPANNVLLPTITMWDYADWNATTPERPSRELLARRKLQYFVQCEIPAGGARTFGFTLRVSPNTDWHHLLQPYKDYFTRILGPVQYTGDHRPLIQMCVNKSVAYINAQNPYGFHDGWARLDLKEGVQAFCDQLIPLLKEANGQGVILWGQQGSEPRGAEYRPDFDVLPPEVEANFETLKARFTAAGLKLGVATRPDSIPVRVNWKSDGLVDLDPDNPSHMNMLLARFKNMQDKGCSLFYLDCFGTRVEDVRLARFLREKLGPGVQLYSEMSCDAILPYVGLYMEVHYQGGEEKDPEHAGSIGWLSNETWAVMRWLAPGIVTAVRPHLKEEDSKSGLYYKWMLEHGMTPLEQPGQLQAGLPRLKELLPKYLDEQGQWRK